MALEKFSWQRFWHRRGSLPQLDFEGYLADPEHIGIIEPNVSKLADLAKRQCLVLLGEPGMGKTTAMRDAFEAVSAIPSQAQHIFINLGKFTTDIALLRAVFESGSYLNWLSGTQHLHLFLDSLDECLIRVDTVSAILQDGLGAAPKDRLSLRIACRSAVWPEYLESGLIGQFGSESVDAFELAPLRRVDVELAAEKAKVDPAEFLAHIEEQNAIPLAIRPVTLNFLLNTYKRSASPPNRCALYLEGCRVLCEEPSQARLASPKIERPNVARRLDMAARMAAVMIFARKSAIWAGPDLGNRPESDIAIDDFIATAKGGEQEASQDALRDALHSNLLISLDANRFVFAHQTYAEFLAAHFLIEHELVVGQIDSLITHPGDPIGRIVPQLAETTGWIAAMNSEVFHRVLRTDPHILLRSDVATASNDSKKQLILALLAAFDKGEIVDDLPLREHYHKLSYADISADLKPYITARRKEIIVRRAAIDLAEKCRDAWDLQSLFAHLALDSTELLQVREQAAHAVSIMGTAETKLRLLPLATDSGEADENDQLKGIALQALWPDFITGASLFAALTPPKRDSFYGAYASFISSSLTGNLEREDLAAALRWVTRQPRRHNLTLSLRKLMDRIFEVAFERLDQPDILPDVVDAVVSRIKQHDELIEHARRTDMPNALAVDSMKRLTLAYATAARFSPDSHEALALLYGGSRLFLADDIPCIVAELKRVPSPAGAMTLAHIVKRLCYLEEPRHVDAILAAFANVPALRDAFGDSLEAVEIESPRGRKMRAERLKMRRLNDRASPPPISPPPAARVAKLLAEFEDGKLEAWWQLHLEMTLQPFSTRYGNEFEFDLTSLPGWQSADLGIRERITAAGRQFILKENDHLDGWLGTNTFHRPAAAGYRALLLLQRIDAPFIQSLKMENWERWAGAVLAFSHRGGEERKADMGQIIMRAYRGAPDVMIEVLLRITDSEDLNGQNLHAIEILEPCWDDRIAQSLLHKVQKPGLKPQSVRDLLNILLKHRVQGAQAFAFELMQEYQSLDPAAKERATVAAVSIALNCPAESWGRLWALISSEEQFGKGVIESVAASPLERRRGQTVRALPEQSLADLYIWLEQQFPQKDDPKHNESYWVGPREAVSEFRDKVLEELQERGTVQSRMQFSRIVNTLDHIPWLKWAFVRARERTLERTWTPPSPRDVLQLAKNRESRFVESALQLMEVVQESLERLNKELQGQTPAAPDCWDARRPKDEEAISNYVKRYLEKDLIDRGIVVNREVQIRRGEGQPGERLDIKIDAVAKSEHPQTTNSVSIIVEVKGIWNPDVETAMQSQLRDRYLKDNVCQCGLYLVLWPLCTAWDSSDSRYARARKWTKEKALRLFSRQASETSGDGVTIHAQLLDISLR